MSVILGILAITVIVLVPIGWVLHRVQQLEKTQVDLVKSLEAMSNDISLISERWKRTVVFEEQLERHMASQTSMQHGWYAYLETVARSQQECQKDIKGMTELLNTLSSEIRLAMDTALRPSQRIGSLR